MTNAAPPVLPSIRADFPILATTMHGQPLCYVDNAATTQKPEPVLAAMLDYYRRDNANIGRGYYELGMTATRRYEEAREAVARWLGAAYADEIVFTRGTTDAVNLLAGTLGAGLVRRDDEIVVTGMEHNSNLLPWRRLAERVGARLVVVPPDSDGRVDVQTFAAALGPRTRLAAVTHVSNVLGTVNPVRELASAAHARHLPVVVDGAQAVAHRPVDVRDLGADFYCFSGHKAYGPMGSGVLYGRRELLATLPPYQVGGGTVKGVRSDEPVAYVPVPARLEAGTPDVAAAVGLAAALRYVEDIGREAVQEHDGALVRYAVETLGTLGSVRVVGDPARDPAGIVSIAVDGIHPYDVGGHLDAHGIAVRAGVHCASTFLDDLGLVGTVRLSFAVYNTHAEIDRVRDALRTVRPGDWSRLRPTVRFV